MNQYSSIEHRRDILRFDREVNGLHDGYLLSVQYRHGGITAIHGGHRFDPDAAALCIQVLVTSIRDAVVELDFDGVLEWQIRDDQRDITDCSVSLEPDGTVVWATDPALRREGSYVIARTMRWRIL